MDKNIKNGLIILVSLVAVYLAYKIVNSLLQTFGIFETKADEATKAAPAGAIKDVTAEIKKITNDIAKSKVLTAAQKALIKPTYNAGTYATYAGGLFSAMNGVGTDTTAIENIFANMKNRTDVLKLIESYGVKQLSGAFGISDSQPDTLAAQLVSEGAVDAANKGLLKNKVFYKF
jgi:hypothetical protein